MPTDINPTPLKQGDVAPDFMLREVNGDAITRHQYRNKTALVVVMFRPSEAAWEYVSTLAQDEQEYQELNVTIIAAVRTAIPFAVPRSFPEIVAVAADEIGKAWAAYTSLATDSDAIGIFVLDLYGGLDSQFVALSVAELPAASKVLEWARGAQYRCNI